MEGEESRMVIMRWCKEEDWLALSEEEVAGADRADRLAINVFPLGSKVGEGEPVTVRWLAGEDYLMLEREVPLPGMEMVELLEGSRQAQDLMRQEFDEMILGWPGIVTLDFLPEAQEIVQRLGVRLYLDGLNKHTFLTALDNLVRMTYLLRAKYRRWLRLEWEMDLAPGQGDLEQGLPEETRPAWQPTKVICPKCGYQSEAGKRFCSRCGTPLP